MQNYGPVFARIYNQRWTSFARMVAPLILDYYQMQQVAAIHQSLLDVACGTGQIAAVFLEAGFRVTGLDLSPHMLAYARAQEAASEAAERATFIEMDVSSFTVDETFGLAISTFDAMNHLPDREALEGCFRSVREALVRGGIFIFDMNTRRGLLNWNAINIEDTDDFTIINRGIYDGDSERAYTRITGFARRDDGAYDRFAQTYYNTVYVMADVLDLLDDCGFAEAHIADVRVLGQAMDDPEMLNRAWFVARV